MRTMIARVVMVATVCLPLVGAVGGSPHVSAATAVVDCAPQPTGTPITTAPLVSYTSINPIRIVDTRNNIGGVNTPIGRGCTMRVNVSADIPSNAQAVALSMTAVDGDADYFTVYPCASGRPETSNLNARLGFPTPNLVVAIPDANRDICIFSHGRANLILDVNGWWSDGPSRFTSIAPKRVYDSRQPGFTALSRFQVREIQIPANVIGADATTAVVNLTADNASQAGYLTAFPCGQPAPNASNVNFRPGEARAVGAIVGLGLGRTLCVMADTAVHVIVDVTGYYSPAPDFGPTAVLEPTAGRRVVDSRNGIGGPKQMLAAGEVRAFDPVVGLADGDDATAVMLNFVATEPSAQGFLTAYPCGGAVPEVSNLNFVGGEMATNLSTVELGADGKVCVMSSVATNLIVDVFGVMKVPSGSALERLSFDTPTWPPFDPAATDYVVECRAGSGAADVALNIESRPSTTTTVSVNGATPRTVGNGATSVSMRTDELLIVSATRHGVVSDYHFRCVPLDFPRLEVLRPGNPTPGWYLTTTGFASPNPARNGPYLMILDNHGAPVWYKRAPGGNIDLKRVSDGRLAFTPTDGPYGIHESQGYWVTNLQGTVTTKHRTASPATRPTDHKEYIELTAIPGVPGVVNGRTLLSCPIVPWPAYSVPPSWAAGLNKIADDVIQEVDGNGDEIWEWTMSDHFDPASATFPLNFGPSSTTGAVPGFPNAWNVYHVNSLDRQPDGDYVASARHLDTVFRVDRDTGNVVWTLGAVTSPGAKHLSIVGDPYGRPIGQHDARLNGNVLTMYDNRRGTGPHSRVVAYSIDETAGTATFLWQILNGATYTGDTLGSARQADDGSVVVGWSAGLQPIIEEFDSHGKRLMAIGLPFGGNSYRTVKYPVGDFNVADLRAAAGGTVVSPS